MKIIFKYNVFVLSLSLINPSVQRSPAPPPFFLPSLEQVEMV